MLIMFLFGFKLEPNFFGHESPLSYRCKDTKRILSSFSTTFLVPEHNDDIIKEIYLLLSYINVYHRHDEYPNRQLIFCPTCTP